MDLRKYIGETTEYDKKEMLEEKKPKSWCKSVSAFANSHGGVLIFGVSDNDIVVGIGAPEKVAEKISETIKAKMDPIPDTTLKIEEVDGKALVVLEISAGTQTPYYYVSDGTRVAFVRIGNESVPADTIKLRELVLRGSNYTYDSLASKYELSDYAFSKLRAAYKKSTGNSFIDSDFESLGLVEGRYLTNAGALLADDSPIRHSRIFCTRWNGLTMTSGTMDAIDSKEFSGSLILLLENGLNFITTNSKKKWKKLSDHRVEMPDYPERSVLVGLVKALIHRSYLEIGSEVHIDLFDDRLEIYSPGGMYDGTKVQERDIYKIPSKRRNPVIADVFNRLHFMERRGSGFKKICEDYAFAEGYTEEKRPRFISDNDNFTLILPNLNYKTSASSRKKGGKNVGKNVGENVGKNVGENLNKREKEILLLISANPTMTQEEIAKTLNIAVRTVERNIKGLRDKNKIRREGSHTKGIWVIVE